jgi:DNA-binding response OmpR family regulator
MTSLMPEMLPRIAVVEDDRDLLDSTLEYLHAQGYPAWGVGSAEEFYKRFAVNAVDVVVLDIGLPGEDGISVARHLRELPNLTVIIVSARDTVDDRLVGLRAGADRYLVKPVNFSELVANIETISRRPVRSASDPIVEEKSKAGHWHLAKRDWRLTEPGGKSLVLTAREFYLLDCLFKARNEPVSRKMIADKIFDHHVLNSSERLDVLLARLRKKCAATLGQPLPIKAVYQVGYVFTAAAVLEE